ARNGRLYQVTGDLTIKGITHPAQFQCFIEEEGQGLRAHGSLSFDRTKYDIRYRSGAFFEDLDDKLIHDEVQLAFDLHTKYTFPLFTTGPRAFTRGPYFSRPVHSGMLLSFNLIQAWRDMAAQLPELPIQDIGLKYVYPIFTALIVVEFLQARH